REQHGAHALHAAHVHSLWNSWFSMSSERPSTGAPSSVSPNMRSTPRSVPRPGVYCATQHPAGVAANDAPHAGESVRSVRDSHTTRRELRDPQRHLQPGLRPAIDDLLQVRLVAVGAQREPRSWLVAVAL